MLWLASLLIIFALFTTPIGRPDACSFLFFVATVDQPSVACELPWGRVLSAGVPQNVSLSVGAMVEIGNSFGSARLAVFARSVSFILAGHSVDHDICSPP
jgi:hypothetical protein